MAGDPLAAILDAPIVRCDVAPWSLLGVSLAGWNFLFSTAAALAIDGDLLSAEEVGQEQLLVVVGRGHPWFGLTQLQPDQLRESPWVMRERGSGAQALLQLPGQDGAPGPQLLQVAAQRFIEAEPLRDEVFGPCSLLVRCANLAEVRAHIDRLDDEIVRLMSGSAELQLEWPTGIQAVHLRAGDAYVIPKGAWHTLKVAESCRILHITMGAGTQHRPL